MRPRAWFLAGMVLTSVVPSLRSQSTANTPKKVRRPSAAVPVPPPPPARPAVSARCPVVSVSSPAEVNEDDPITFTTSVKGGDSNVTPTFNWTVSAGTISSGQGTSVITVDTQGAGSMSVTATVSLGGYEARCRTTQSGTTGVVPKPPPARKFDQFGVLSQTDLTDHLDNFAIQLQSEPGARGYLIAFSGRTSPAGSAAARLKTMKDYLVETRGIEFTRLVTINGGVRERSGTELWIVPPGAKPPL